MNLESIQIFFSSEMAQGLGWCLVHSLWQFSLIAFAAFAILQWMSRTNSESRYIVSMAAMLLCLMSVVFTLSLVETTSPVSTVLEASTLRGADSGPPRFSDPASALNLLPSEAVDLRPDQSISSVSRSESVTEDGAFWGDGVATLLQQCIPWMVAFWATGVCLFALRPLLGIHSMWTLRRQATAVPQDLQTRFERLLINHSVGRHTRLLRSVVASVPMVLGFVRPVVIVPVACLSQLSARELEAILLHELAHLRRYDDWFNLIQVLIETLFFYHPALWWISNQIRIERENCCDDFVVAADRRNSKHLATALLSLETGCQALTGQAALHATDGELVTRVRRLVGAEHVSPGWLGKLGPMCLVVGLAISLSLGNGQMAAEGGITKASSKDSFKIDPVETDPIETDPVAVEMTFARDPLSKPVEFSTVDDLRAILKETDSLIYTGDDQNAFDDDACLFIAAKFSKLRQLDVSYARSVTDKGVAELAKLESLVALRMRFANQVTVESVQALVARGSLVSLDVSYCPAFTDDQGAAELVKLSSLRNLILLRHSGNGMTDESRIRLVEHKSLERVIVNGPQHGFASKLNELRTDPMAPGFTAPFRDSRNYRFVVVRDAPGTNHWKGLSLLGHSRLANEKFINQITYQERREYLTREHKESWVAIVGGVVFISPESMDEVCKLADAAFPEAEHRFVFQAGVHDIAQAFGYSPWITGRSNWWQFGRQFRSDHNISISSDKWLAHGKTIGTLKGHASIELLDVGGRAKTPLVRHAVCSAMSEHQMAITEYDVEQLGLDRYAIPGMATSQMYRRDFERTWVKVRVNGLEIEQNVVAFVAPKSLVDLDTPVELRSPDQFKRWSVLGRVSDFEGNPLKGVTIKVFSGIGSLRQSGVGKTDDDGRYNVKFGEGFRFLGNSTAVQAATVYAQMEGYTELNLCRQGDRLMSSTDQFEDSGWGTKEEVMPRLILPGKPVEIDFVMGKAAKLEGYLTDDQFRGYANQKLSLTGKDLPPSSSVYQQVTTDENGKFSFVDVPAGKEWWLEFTVPNTGIEVSGKKLTFAEGQNAFRHVVVRPQAGDLKTFEMMVAEPNQADRQKLSVIGKNLVFGSAVKNNDKRELVWSDAKNGLRAAILNMPETVKIGSISDLQVVVQNTSKATITFESTRWRQEDTATLLVNDKLVEGSKVWYTGWPRVQTIELKRGEEVTLRMAGVLMGGVRDPKLTPAYVFSAQPGKAEFRFDLKLPDVGYGEKGHWIGTLTTGAVKFELVD